jgi:hypothetical protein
MERLINAETHLVEDIMTKRHFAAAWHECRLKAARKKSQRGKKA